MPAAHSMRMQHSVRVAEGEGEEERGKAERGRELEREGKR